MSSAIAGPSYRHIELGPMSGCLGVEISGVDLSVPLAGEVVAEIRKAFTEHHLVVFRNQSLTPDQQADFCAQLGKLATYPFVEATTEHPNVIPIIKEADQERNFGGAWHTDSSYMERPPKATCLYAVEAPARGGDTMFANTNAAFEALSEGMQRMVGDVVGIFTPSLVHGSSGAFAAVGDHGKSMKKRDNPDVAEQRVRHPIIRTHPDTGRKAIYASVYHCERFEGMTRDESLPLLRFLHEHATKLDFTTRLRWQEGTLAVWDNRCVFHYALNDYHGERRHMRRVTIEGEIPA